MQLTLPVELQCIVNHDRQKGTHFSKSKFSEERFPNFSFMSEILGVQAMSVSTQINKETKVCTNEHDAGTVSIELAIIISIIVSFSSQGKSVDLKY